MAKYDTISSEAAPVQNRKGINWERLRHISPLYLMVLPTIIMLLIFFYYPAINGFLTSFQYVDVRGSQWVGLENYQRLFSDTRLLQSFRNLAFLAVFNVCVFV
ncbi:MAG: sugar ABC transporter permease, partial [Anaerolineae bacterium]|nr:sugar ABC transporter permease [Anaerolineae bacterium]